MAYCDPRCYYKKDKVQYDNFINQLALFGSNSIRRGYKIRLFSSDVWFDARAIDDLEVSIQKAARADTEALLACERVETFSDFLAQLDQVDCVVTCRFHGVVFAHLLNKPVIALSHHPKVSNLMSDFGMSEYCLDIERFDAECLMEALEKLLADKDKIKERIRIQVESNKEALMKQFDQLFPAPEYHKWGA